MADNPTAAGAASIPSLDGLRAFSILGVILGHAAATHGAPHFLKPFEHTGNIGVRMFFVISGFLITTLLLRERESTGTVHLGHFFARRALRILPAFFFFIGVVWVMSAFGLTDLRDGDVLHAMTFTMNYHHENGWALNHIWSLSVEEQFYLAWPALVFLLSARGAARTALFVVLAAPLVRVVMLHYFGASDRELSREFQAVADTLAFGCLLACNYSRWMSHAGYARFVRSLAAPCAALLVLGASLAMYRIDVDYYYLFAQSTANLAMMVLLNHAVEKPQGFVGSILRFRPIAYIGLLSYSLYLWQEIFLNPFEDRWFTHFPGNLALTIAAGLFSYYIVERPLRRLRSHFGSRHAPTPAAS